MIYNICMKNNMMVDEQICRQCIEQNCRHAGELTTSERLALYEVIDDVGMAFKRLGYWNPIYRVEHRDCHYYNVYLDDKYFGIWDALKQTFVD